MWDYESHVTLSKVRSQFNTWLTKSKTSRRATTAQASQVEEEEEEG